MPTTNWNTTTIDGKEYLVIDSAQFRVPLDWDPSSNMFLAVAAPTGGLGSFPALVKGDTGDVPTLSTVNFTALEADDPTPDSAAWTETSPGVYELDLVLHKGPQGDQGDTVITPSDFGTPAARQIIVVNDTMDDFEYQSQLCGDRYIPGSVAPTAGGNPTWTLCTIAVPAQPFDWRPIVSGQSEVTLSKYTAVDIIARLNNETSGNIVGRGYAHSWSAVYPRQMIITNGPPPGASDTYDVVSAGYAATIYIRLERQAGTGTFTVGTDKTYVNVRVAPVPVA